MALPEIELIRIPAADSGCTGIGEQAIVWQNNGDTKTTSWANIKHDWNFENLIYVLGEGGYTARYLALFVGEDKNNLHCYVIYDPDF
jgi:hypothetical protein